MAVDENVTFDCKAVGWPTPSLRLVNIDNNTVISSSLSPLSFTLFSAQCQDTATYSCIASNAMGSDLTTKAKLEVICKYIWELTLHLFKTINFKKSNFKRIEMIFSLGKHLQQARHHNEQITRVSIRPMALNDVLTRNDGNKVKSYMFNAVQQ